MNWMVHIVRFFIPFIVLYTIGYYVPGFSALTITWIFILSALVFSGDWLVEKIFRFDLFGRFQRGIISLLVSAIVVFVATLAIPDGNVPFGSSILAALIIGILISFIPDTNEKINKREALK